MRSPIRILTVVFAIVGLISLLPAAAVDDPSTPGALQVAQPDGTVVELPLRHTKVAIEVTAFVARATVEQAFANPFAEPVEALDIAVHAVATWALAEAAAAGDESLISARKKALDYLVAQAQPNGWPAWPGGTIDAETTRWVRLVLSKLQPASLVSMPAPAGEPTERYKRLRASLAAAKSGGQPPKMTGRSSFDRLVGTIGRGHLSLVMSPG